MQSGTSRTEARQAVINGLAVIGFAALLFAGMALAVYTARYVPVALSNLASAAVYFSSIFIPAGSVPTLEVVDTEIPFEEPPLTETPTVTIPTTPVAPATPVIPNGGTKTDTTYQIGTSPAPLSGLSDLVMTITAVGYLASTSTDSFVATTTIPAHSRVAVKFMVENKGTNKTGDWRFSLVIPTESSYLFESPVQQSLNPNDRIEYVLGFDQAKRGVDQPITASVDFDKKVNESNEDNNGANAKVTVLGT